ncbi:MAG: hypothetical protein HY094_09630 [Candidatus Melainabacteria bacterium]|nr:hypothetical protein [Candidatus Melainabacteria bacterium]
MKRVLVIGLITCMFTFIMGKAPAQDASSSSGGMVSVEAQAQQIIVRLKTLQGKLNSEKGRINHLRAKKIKLLIRKLIRAVNSIPSTKCLEKLKVAMYDFYGLVSEVGSGIACGPPIIRPFLQQVKLSLTPDCIPPDITPDQLDPVFVELNPIYDDAQKLSIVDYDGNGVSDVCEGALNP